MCDAGASLYRCCRHRYVAEVVLSDCSNRERVCDIVTWCFNSTHTPILTDCTDKSNDAKSSYGISDEVWLSCSVKCCCRSVLLVIIRGLRESSARC